MKRLFIVCLALMMMAGTSLKAQEITITLSQGWNWISYPNAVSMEIGEALGNFVPMEGDIIKSQSAFSSYHDGIWTGGLSHFMPGKGYVYYSSRSETTSFVFSQAASSVVATATPTDITAVSALVGGMVMLPEGSHVFLRGVCWGTEPNPTIDGNHTTEGTTIGGFSGTLEGLTPSTTYYVRAYVVSDFGLAYGNQLSFTTLDESSGNHACVDLGLPSGLLWASCNVGAETPEGYGDHFAWGETEPKGSYSWFNYHYCYGNEFTLTKYCNESSFGYNDFSDDLTILLPEDDAATANWGTDWRMPIREEWQELFNNTTRIWTNRNGVNGWLFTGSNGNTIFLPAAGFCIENGFYSAGSVGYYWSSSLNTDEPYYSWRVDLNSGNYQVYQYGYRYFGQSVRPVHTLQYSVTTTPNPSNGGIVIGGGSYEVNTLCTLTAIPNDGYYFYGWSEGEGGESFGEETYTFTVTGDVTLVANFGYCGIHEYVDLGLPSGTLWARNNVGANAITDHGDYFAWGETQPKDYYSWSNYQYCNGGSQSLTKYCNNASFGYQGFTDNLTVLQPEDDAATANWGSDWRMPTEEEFQELFDNTTVTDLTLNGVEGCLFTASNGNSLFFPYEGLTCWSSTLGLFDPSYAYFFEPFMASYTDDGNRYFGQPVRAVRFMSQNNAPIGAIDGKFTINDYGDQVYFSQGNLQYQASTNTWKFADNQYDYVGSTNSNISSTYDGWIDLFGWGTSGYNHGANCYQPWSTSQANSDYYAYGDYIYYLDSQTGQADWGYNPISNGGNQENQWRTLTYEEWDYIFTTRSTASDIRYAKAQVNNRNGVILLPDDWISDTYSLNDTNNCNASYNSNTITASQWTALENSGAVFLPAAGLRNGTSVINVGGNMGSCGYYWSSLCCNTSFCNNYAILLEFDESSLFTDGDGNRFFGLSVRLVRVVEN